MAWPAAVLPCFISRFLYRPPPQPLNRVLWPYALIALSFYVGLDVMFAGIAEAWEKFKQQATGQDG